MKALEFLHMKFPMWAVQDRLPFNTVSLREENLIEAMEEFAKTEFQIAWELSLSTDKPFFVDPIRKLINSYLKEEISLSKFVEELNVSAYKWHHYLNSNEPGAVSSHEAEKVGCEHEWVYQPTTGYYYCVKCHTQTREVATGLRRPGESDE